MQIYGVKSKNTNELNELKDMLEECGNVEKI